jgi:uroporphyrin-III C-methyltransferase
MIAPDPTFKPAWLDRLILSFQAFRETYANTRPTPHAGFVTLLGAGPGASDLLTLRGLDRLQRADIIFYDRLADPALLHHAPKAEKIYVGKAPGCHAMPQDAINAALVSAGRTRRVVRLKCGDPGIFGRGAEEAAALTAAGIAWEVIPGVTAACAAAASAGSFLTERGQTDTLILATGHKRDGEAPTYAHAKPGTTLALYMGVAQSGTITDALLQAGWPATAQVEIISRAQMPDQRILRSTLQDLAQTCANNPGLNPAILLVRWPATASCSPAKSRLTYAL